MNEGKTASLLQEKYDYIFNHMRTCLSTFLSNVKIIDIKSLIIAFGCVAAIYASLFFYVRSNADNVMAKIESQLDTKTVAVTNNRKSLSAAHQSATHSLSAPEIDSFYENNLLGLLPIIRPSDGMTSFEAFQKKMLLGDSNKPLISFVIIDYGLSKEQSMLALDLLPSEVTFALSPYSILPNEWVIMAKNKGHEVWLNLPIQNDGAMDIGDNTIFHHAPLIKKQKAMRKSLAKAQGYVGVSSFTDSSINKSKGHYFKIINELHDRGLAFLELNPKADKAIKQRSLYMNKPYIKADEKMIVTRGKDAFKELETTAKERGYAIAVIPNYPETIKNLAVWIMKVGQIDYSIVPVSAAYNSQNKTSTKNKSNMSLKANDHVEPQEASTPHETSNH